MVNLMREHVPQETRIHYVITSGGNAPNVVPDFAEVFYYLRHPEARTVKELWVRLEQAALGAARGTGVEVDWEIIHGNHPVLINETLAKMMAEKLQEVGGIEYNEREEAFAQELYPRVRIHRCWRRFDGRTDHGTQCSNLGAGHFGAQLAGSCRQWHEHWLQRRTDRGKNPRARRH
jgi:metal-dependent amidase/aminoacylase/carboxypeptidase family protein